MVDCITYRPSLLFFVRFLWILGNLFAFIHILKVTFFSNVYRFIPVLVIVSDNFYNIMLYSFGPITHKLFANNMHFFTT